MPNNFLNQINNKFLFAPRVAKRIIILTFDLISLLISINLSAFLLNENYFQNGNSYYLNFTVLFSLLSFYFTGLYTTIFRYINILLFIKALLCISISSIFSYFILKVFDPQIINIKIIIVNILFSFFFVFITRSSINLYVFKNKYVIDEFTNTLIYGAGSAGITLSTLLTNNNKYKLKGFVDDNPSLVGNYINGHLVIHPDQVGAFARKKNIKSVIIAIPSLEKRRKQEIFNIMLSQNLSVLTLPSLSYFNENVVKISDIQEVEIDNIIKRKSHNINKNFISTTIENSTVIISGAGGSIGYELCQQVVNNNCSKIILLDINEFNLYKVNESIENLLKNLNKNFEIVAILGSICDRELIRKIIKKYKPKTIFHTAAYKHVPIVEENKIQGIFNNAIGTYIITEAAFDLNVENFILISSDKAVRPTNMMGATKRLSEMIVQSFANEIKTIGENRVFSMVRFGNVIGSSGSVIPKFKSQIKNGGPVTVTDRNIIRYFMTINEAVELVIQASAIAKGGEVFLLDMREPIKILDIAIRLIRSYGYKIDENTLDGDIPIMITGLKPGEKLYEELLINKNAIKTSHPNIFKANEPFIPLKKIKKSISKIYSFIEKGKDNEVLTLINDLIPEYTPYKR